MNVNYPALQAEMMTVETAAERRAIWDRVHKEAAGMERYIADVNRKWRLEDRAESERRRALPWWRRLFA